MTSVIRCSVGQERFDQIVHGPDSMKDAGDLELVVIKNGTKAGKAAVALSFTVQLPDGQLRRAQTVTTLDALLLAVGTVGESVLGSAT